MKARPLLLGHRGARADKSVPENTLASFELCLAQGCHGFEFDVRLAADGEAVICHDARSRRKQIAKSSSRDLNLPTLREVLQTFASRAFLDIELKVAGLEPQTVALLREFPPQRGFVVSSFLPDVLSTLHRIAPEIPLGLICETKRQLSKAESLPLQLVMLHQSLATPQTISATTPSRVMVWTVNRESAMRRLASLGVAGIISDQTALLGKLRAEKKI